MIGISIVLVTLVVGLIVWFFVRSHEGEITPEEYQYNRLKPYIEAEDEILKEFIKDNVDWLGQTEDMNLIIRRFNNRD